MADLKRSLRALRSMAIIGGVVASALPLSACWLNPCAARSRNPCAPRAASPCGAKLARSNPGAPSSNPCAAAGGSH